VQSINEIGESDQIAMVTCSTTLPPTPPPQVEGGVCTSIRSGEAIQLVWTEVASRHAEGISGYGVQVRSQDGVMRDVAMHCEANAEGVVTRCAVPVASLQEAPYSLVSGDAMTF